MKRNGERDNINNNNTHINQLSSKLFAWEEGKEITQVMQTISFAFSIWWFWSL
jgi:hypothetical protein